MFVSHWLETFGDERWTWTPERCDLPALLARNAVNGAALVRRAASKPSVATTNPCARVARTGISGCGSSRRASTARSFPKCSSTIGGTPLDESRDDRTAGVPAAARGAGQARPAYRGHLATVIVSKEAERLGLADEIAALERERLNVLEPALERAEEELRALRVGRAA